MPFHPHPLDAGLVAGCRFCPAPAISLLGLALMSWHLGICRSAAVSLNLLPQCGQSMRLGSGADAMGAPPNAVTPACNIHPVHLTHIDSFVYLYFHFLVLCRFTDMAYVMYYKNGCLISGWPAGTMQKRHICSTQCLHQSDKITNLCCHYMHMHTWYKGSLLTLASLIKFEKKPKSQE